MSKVKREPAPSAPDPKPAPVGHHTLRSLEVTGGFLRGARFEFTDGLNCIIGGRGTGKTTVLEFVRYALGLMPDPRTSPARAKALAGLVQGNLGPGRVRVEVETKHGMHYVADRTWNDPAQVLDSKGEPTTLSLDRDAIFKADIYSQNEIEEIATDSKLQLALIDRFVEDDVRRLEGEISKVDRELAQNAADLLRLSRAMRDLRDGVSEGPVVEEKLKALRKTGGPDAKLLNAAHAQRALRERERQGLVALRGDLARLQGELDSTVTALVRRLESRLDSDLSDGLNQDLLASVSKPVRAIVTSLQEGSRSAGRQTAVAEASLAKLEPQLATRHAKQDAEYRALVAQSREDSGLAAERVQLQQRHLEIGTARKELEVQQKEYRTLERQRRELLGQLSELRDQRFALRVGVAKRLTAGLAPMIRVSIIQAGGQDTYAALLTGGLTGSGLRYASLIEKLVHGVTPEELATLVQSGDAAGLSERGGFDLERSERVIALLRDSELLYRIETVPLDDLPRIELLDGKGYKDSAGLSTGQRCTTILPILLLESERPLLIDQPEDNLDNAFIYATVVKTLKRIKTQRQLLFVTHNPNIPVLGDAERVFVMESDGKESHLKTAGTVDALKGEIEFLLEGGSEAFRERMKRYGH